MAFTSDQAELIGAELQSVAYGIYLIMFSATLYVLLSRAKLQNRRANKLLLVGSIFLFCCVTSHWILDQTRLWAAFIQEEGVPDGPLLFYRTQNDKRDVARNIILVCEVITIDSLLIYRLFVIWNKNWRVIVVPTLTLMATIVAFGKAIADFTTSPPDADPWTLPVAKWIVASFSLTLTTNVIAVALIAGRIVYRDRKMKTLGAGSLSSIATITIESAGIYCLVNFAIVVSLVARTPLDLTIRDIASPITGISFCLITLRVGLGKSLAWLTHGMPPSLPGMGGRRGGTTMPMQVCITHEEDTNPGSLDRKTDNSELARGRAYMPGESPQVGLEQGSWA